MRKLTYFFLILSLLVSPAYAGGFFGGGGGSAATAATDAEARTGTSDTVMITPLKMMNHMGLKGSDIASAATLTIPATGNKFDVTGTTTISSFSSIANAQTGFEILLKFEGALKLVNSASLVLPGGKDLLVFNGDTLRASYEGSGVWRVNDVTRVSGAPADPAPIRSVWSYAYPGASYNNGGDDGATGTRTITNAVGHPGGVVTLSTGTAADGYASVSLLNIPGSGAVVGTDPIVAEIGFNIATLADGTEDYDVRVGLIGGLDIRAVVDSITLLYDRDTNTDWLLETCNDSTCTTTDSNVVVATGDKRLTLVVNAAGTSVEFFLNGVSMGTQATNLPTGTGDEMTLGAGIDKEAGTTARTMNVNFFSFTQYLTTPR